MMEQKITTATRGSNILDLFITNNEELVAAIRTEDTIMSDHKLVVVEQKQKLRGTRLYKSMRFIHITKLLQ